MAYTDSCPQMQAGKCAVEDPTRRSERTAVAVPGVLAIAAAAPAVDDHAAGPTPTIRVEQKTIDLGDVIAGSEAVAVFRFQNVVLAAMSAGDRRAVTEPPPADVEPESRSQSTVIRTASGVSRQG